ncbi:MAG: YihY family inner membrane protein [Rhodanobacteraceae bacterium]|nr:MAG: YihY family inner membrane protein [Rhodanobacteraceae bacterium]
MNRDPAHHLSLRRERLRAFARFLWRRFRDDKCFETAGALSYTTLFAIVPMLAAVVAVMSVIPAFASLRDRATHFIFRSFVPAAGETVQGYLLQFADNASKLTVVGVLFLVVSALMMMASIEDRFDRIWRVPARRKGSSRFLLYWAALTLGPLLIVVGVAASSWVYAQPLWRGVAGYGVVGFKLWALAPFLITWLALSILYAVVPNRRVHWRDAVLGALLASILFELARRGFAVYVQGFANYTEVYGALAAVPIFMIWIYLSWVIVLLGATFTAARDAFEYRAEDETLPPGCELVGLLRVLQQFALAQHAGEGLAESTLTARERFLTPELLQRYLGDLRRTGLIQRNESGAWVLVRDLDSVHLDDLFRIGGYRLPADALSLQAAADGLAPAAVDALLRAQTAERENLALPLRSLFARHPVVAPEEASP